MEIKKLKWISKDCCGLHKHAIVPVSDEGYFQIDVFDAELYTIAFYTNEDVSIPHKLLGNNSIIDAVSTEALETILKDI